jgi:hypothetical protein
MIAFLVGASSEAEDSSDDSSEDSSLEDDSDESPLDSSFFPFLPISCCAYQIDV